jgi:hypothetical protein
MAIVVLSVALAAYVYALVVEPGFRRWGLLGGAAIGLGLAVYFWNTAPESERAGRRITPQDLVLDQLELERTRRGATLTGRVRNDSAGWRLREMTLAVRLLDCPAPDAPPEDCPVIGEATAIARPDAPPGQVRGFSAHFIFENVPRPSGTLDWDWRIVETRATE